MVARGLVEEVQGLLDAGVPLDGTAMQAIGYKELARALPQGEDLAQAVEEGPIPVNPAEGCKLPGGRTPGDAGADPGGDAAPFDSGQGGRLL